MTKLEGYISNLADELAKNPDMYNIPLEPNATDVTWQYVAPLAMGARRLLLNSISRSLPNIMPTVDQIVDNFYSINNPNLVNMPEEYLGERDFNNVLDFLGNRIDNYSKIETPYKPVILNENNLAHYLYENNPERLKDLGLVKNTFESPSLIIKGQRYGNDYNYYAKPYLQNNKVRGHLNITRDKNTGNFYQTNFRLRKSKLKDLINNGQVMYNNLPVSTAPISKDIPVNNIINDNSGNFKGLTDIIQLIKSFFK